MINVRSFLVVFTLLVIFAAIQLFVCEESSAQIQPIKPTPTPKPTPTSEPVITYIPTDEIRWDLVSSSGDETITIEKLSKNAWEFKIKPDYYKLAPSEISAYPYEIFNVIWQGSPAVKTKVPVKYGITFVSVPEDEKASPTVITNSKTIDLYDNTGLQLYIDMRFVDIENLYLKYGPHSATYSAVNNKIVWQSGDSHDYFEDIYQADVTNGWGVSDRCGTRCYVFSASIEHEAGDVEDKNCSVCFDNAIANTNLLEINGGKVDFTNVALFDGAVSTSTYLIYDTGTPNTSLTACSISSAGAGSSAIAVSGTITNSKLTNMIVDHIGDYHYFHNNQFYNSVLRGHSSPNMADSTMAYDKFTSNTYRNVGYWAFDEDNLVASGTAIDSSENGNDGDIFNCGTQTAGKFGQALFFDGTDDYVDCGNVDVSSKNKSTVAFWMYTPDISQVSIVISKHQDNNNRHPFIYLSGDNLNTVISEGAADGATVASFSAYANKWVHVAQTFDGTTQVLYLNGVEVDSDNTVLSLPTNAADLDIGQKSDGTSRFDGQIDEVRIYNYALSEGEIEYLYNQSIPVHPYELNTTGDGSLLLSDISTTGNEYFLSEWKLGIIETATNIDTIDCYSDSWVNFYGANNSGTFTRSYTLDIEVLNTSGSPIQNATVGIENNNYSYTYLTSASGTIPTTTCRYETEIFDTAGNSTDTFENPYTITVAHDDYLTYETQYLMDIERDLSIALQVDSGTTSSDVLDWLNENVEGNMQLFGTILLIAVGIGLLVFWRLSRKEG